MAGKTEQNGNLLDLYFQDIAGSQPLLPEEEVELAQQIQAGSRLARNRLVTANLRFAVRLACEYRNNGVALEDLISAGNVGLIKAADRFDGARGCKFITYASWWVRQAIRQSLSQDSRMVRLPSNRIKLLQSIANLSRKWRQNREVEPGPESFAEALGVSVELVRDTLAKSRRVCSLDAQPGQDLDSRSLQGLLPDDAQETPDAEVSKASDRRQLGAMLDSLDDREAEVLRRHYGLDDKDPETLEEIGRHLGLSKERIRQIEEKALGKLRHPTRRVVLETLRATA